MSSESLCSPLLFQSCFGLAQECDLIAEHEKFVKATMAMKVVDRQRKRTELSPLSPYRQLVSQSSDRLLQLL